MPAVLTSLQSTVTDRDTNDGPEEVPQGDILPLLPFRNQMT